MQTFKSQLLQVFGLDRNYFAIGNDTIQLQRENECAPFAEILTDKTGHMMLRVGDISPNVGTVITVN